MNKILLKSPQNILAGALCLLFINLILVGCQSPDAATPTLTNVIPASPTGTQAQPTDTPLPASATPTRVKVDLPTSTPLPSATPSPGLPPQAEGSIVIDHTSVDLFEKIPAEYIQKASQLSLLYQHASVGWNLDTGLNCIQNYFPDRPNPNRRPSSCDRDLDPGMIVIDPKYDRSNWTFEGRQSSVWDKIVEGFIERVDSLAPEESFDVVTYDWGYFLNETALAFFEESSPDSRFPSVADLQALEDRHPDKRVIYWTTQFARLGMPDLITFNERMRHYAQANGKILFDMADIESHRPDGTPCTGLDDDKNPVEVPALCDEYTNEVIGGHLNALGRLQGAKAFWVLMARLAGWNPQS